MASASKPQPLLTEGMTTVAEVAAEFGPRCPDVDMECVCCKAWLEWDLRNVNFNYKEDV